LKLKKTKKTNNGKKKKKKKRKRKKEKEKEKKAKNKMSRHTAIEFVPVGDGHWKKVLVDLDDGRNHPFVIEEKSPRRSLKPLHTFGHPAHESHHPLESLWSDEEFSGEEFSGEEFSDGEEFDEEVEPEEPVYGNCHLMKSEDEHLWGKSRPKYNRNQIVDEDWLSPRELEMLRKRQRRSTMVQTATTAGGALAGVLVGGPFGGAIGGAGGSLLGEAISPTPNRTSRGLVRHALWGAVGGGLSPLVFGGALAPWAATIGGGLAGRHASR
jgi:hypothetical protein